MHLHFICVHRQPGTGAVPISRPSPYPTWPRLPPALVRSRTLPRDSQNQGSVPWKTSLPAFLFVSLSSPLPGLAAGFLTSTHVCEQELLAKQTPSDWGVTWVACGFWLVSHVRVLEKPIPPLMGSRASHTGFLGKTLCICLLLHSSTKPPFLLQICARTGPQGPELYLAETRAKCQCKLRIQSRASTRLCAYLKSCPYPRQSDPVPGTYSNGDGICFHLH